jgi:hypothetical protein
MHKDGVGGAAVMACDITSLWGCGPDSLGLDLGTVAGSSEHGSESEFQ